MFKPATKSKSRLRLALMGPSGSGKTYTALRAAHLLTGNGKIAYIDTENGSASKYVGEAPDGAPWSFDVMEMGAPYTPKRFADAIRAAESAGYGVIVIDSMTHMWSGRGGMLDIVDEKSRASRSGNSFEAWGAVKPLEREFWDAIVACKIDLICCFRTKSEWVIEKNANGKNAPRKIGTKAEQRDGVEYEFDVALMLDEDNVASVIKTRCSALTGLTWSKPGRDVVDPLRAWLSDGAPAAETPATARPPEPSPAAPTTQPTRSDRAFATLAEAGWTREAVKAYGAAKIADLEALAALVVGDSANAKVHRRLGKRIVEVIAADRMPAALEMFGNPPDWIIGEIADAHKVLSDVKAWLAADAVAIAPGVS